MEYHISAEESKRISFLKTISIVFVLYIHAYAVEIGFSGEVSSLGLPMWLRAFEDYISKVISGFAVPMYFFLSSVLLFKSERKYVYTMKNKIKTLLVPYIFWNTMGILIFLVLENLSFTAPFFSGMNTPICESSFVEWMALYGIGADCPKVYPLWFLRDLMIVTALFPLIGMVAKKVPVIALAAGCILILSPEIIFFQKALAWFLLGAGVVRLNLHMEMLDKIPVFVCGMIYILSSLFVLLVNHIVLDRLFLIIGVLFWIRFSKEIEKNTHLNRWVKYLVPWTFVIYAFHEPAMTALKKICMKIFPLNPFFLFMEYFLIPIIIVFGCVFGGYLFKRTMPKLYAIATGER